MYSKFSKKFFFLNQPIDYAKVKKCLIGKKLGAPNLMD